MNDTYTSEQAVESVNPSMMVDPPAGWRYGFPKPYDAEKGLEKMLREAGYPEKDMDLALCNSRFWVSYKDNYTRGVNEV